MFPSWNAKALLVLRQVPPHVMAKGNGSSVSERCSITLRTFSQVGRGGSLSYTPAAHTHTITPSSHPVIMLRFYRHLI